MTNSTSKTLRIGESEISIRDAGSCRTFSLKGLADEGSSTMKVYRVVPGIAASFYEFGSSRCNVFNAAPIACEVMAFASMSDRMLEVNVSRGGSFTVLSGAGEKVASLQQGDVSLALTHVANGRRRPAGGSQADWSIDLPSGCYRGLGLIVDLDTAISDPQSFTRSVGVDLAHLVCSYRLETGESIMEADFRTETIVDSIYRHHEDNDPALVRLCALELLAAIASRSPRQEGPDRVQRSIEIARLVREARNFAADHLDKRYTIEEMSRMFNISPTAFKTAFRAFYGMPYAQYMTSLRMERAKAMLSRGELVLSVSFAIGYESPGKFSAAFKRFFGETPSSYRSRMRA